MEMEYEEAKRIVADLKEQWGTLAKDLDIPGSYAEFNHARYFLEGWEAREKKGKE